ncbi:DUF6477 family protein [Maritimibacter sp. DP1N21-5]|uniref:DUF6477 family protein n=1 Tax=Maritimibacter sp. DP1N21-5 TaxID=2836867 RepID=UPI001C490B01|nr:DUF6477 family protein [Maritimibacter sp. DP1N21-5]MBV7409828.1 hypothetical protein [Maritimibacter sp. DP1N21-5]
MTATQESSKAQTPALFRPRLLIETARVRLGTYDRDRDLPHVIGQAALPPPGDAMLRLAEEEAKEDRDRRDGVTTYRPARHVALLVALIAEGRLAGVFAP